MSLQLRLLGDGFCAGSFLIGALVLSETLSVKPFRRGFFCEDTSIQKPYIGLTFSSITVVACFILSPVAFLSCFEAIWYYLLHHRTEFDMFYNVFNQFSVFLFGESSLIIFSQVVGLIVGRLKPYFLDVCRPDVNCTLPENHFIYISDYNCTHLNETDLSIWYARQSFPSNTASLAAMSMVYLCLYLNVRLTWEGMNLLKAAIQSCLIGFSFWASITKFLDNANHLSDVISGYFLGTSFAFLFFNLSYNNTHHKETSEKAYKITSERKSLKEVE